jgi:NAD(P) transhydrogenase subunit alpha
VHEHGVEIHGPLNLPSTIPVHASQMYSRNLTKYLQHLIQEGELHLDLEDELTRAPLVTRNGEIVNESVRSAQEN